MPVVCPGLGKYEVDKKLEDLSKKRNENPKHVKNTKKIVKGKK